MTTDREPMQTDHERRVAGIENDRRDSDDALTPEAAPGEVGETPYERELAAEREGVSRREVDSEVAEDEREPLDEAYQPRSG